MNLFLPQSLQQPVQGVPLDSSNRIAAGALAVVTPTVNINWATGRTLTRGGSTAGPRTVSTGGLRSFSFNKDYWLETETLPAVGTRPYVMFWLGWPYATGCVLGPNECGFVVGSSNNTIGIMMNVGGNRAVANGGNAGMWGGCNNEWGTIYSALDTLTFGSSGAPTMLMMVRKSSGVVEFWRNGVITTSLPRALTSVAAFKMEVGSWIAQTNWCSAANTALAGLSVFNSDPTSADLAALSANPWSIFKSQSMLQMLAPLLSNATSRRALIVVNGKVQEIADVLLGTNKKPLVLYQGSIRERVASEGSPIVIVNGLWRTLAPDEVLSI